jgi:hypothetical protein
MEQTQAALRDQTEIRELILELRGTLTQYAQDRDVIPQAVVQDIETACFLPILYLINIHEP